MKKGYYIYFRANSESAGVAKKIDSQIRALNVFFDCQKLIVNREKYQFIKSVMWRLPFGSFGWQYDQAWEQIENPDFIYIRFVLIDRKLLQFIKELRYRFSQCKILLEIPTYPYANEWKSKLSMAPFYIKDMWYHGKLKKYVDRIATFSEDDKIFDIPTLRIINGIWLDDIKVAGKTDNEDKIVLLTVASFQRYHGYERCLSGLSNYYAEGGKKQIEFHMVGDGKEQIYYQDLTKKYHLEKHVFFHGRKTGKELDQFYDIADIAIGSLGFYKIKLDISSNLKVREYLAKGLPIVSGCNEDIFDKSDVDFYYRVPNNSTPIDMEKIIEFYDRLYTGKESRTAVKERIREYANKTVDMKIVIKPIVDFVNN